MDTPIFELVKCQCAYNRCKDPGCRVLDIDNMSIPRGKISFIVGPSGIGKSTVLELLGMMNDTLVSAESFCYNGMNMCDKWRTWKDEQMSSFRRREFSFIFQDNNLMPNFSAFENVMFTAMLQGIDRHEAFRRTKEIFDMLDLPLVDQSIRHYSGGQRQRIAFARGIIPEFNILFCDEPTGNLDHGSANNVMKILSDRIHSTGRTAIIVSHDMALAAHYADSLVIIKRKQMTATKDCGLINNQSRFDKIGNVWQVYGKEMSEEQFKFFLEGGLI